MPRIADPTKAKPAKSIVTVRQNATGWLVAVKLSKIQRDEQPFILNGMISPQFNKQLYDAIDRILPGAAVQCGYGKNEAILQLMVDRDLVGRLLDSNPTDPDLESKLVEYLQPFEKDFIALETMIRKYLDENAAYIRDWRRPVA